VARGLGWWAKVTVAAKNSAVSEGACIVNFEMSGEGWKIGGKLK
jgi:hypothetical protein